MWGCAQGVQIPPWADQNVCFIACRCDANVLNVEVHSELTEVKIPSLSSAEDFIIKCDNTWDLYSTFLSTQRHLNVDLVYHFASGCEAKQYAPLEVCMQLIQF